VASLLGAMTPQPLNRSRNGTTGTDGVTVFWPKIPNEPPKDKKPRPGLSMGSYRRSSFSDDERTPIPHKTPDSPGPVVVEQTTTIKTEEGETKTDEALSKQNSEKPKEETKPFVYPYPFEAPAEDPIIEEKEKVLTTPKEQHPVEQVSINTQHQESKPQEIKVEEVTPDEEISEELPKYEDTIKEPVKEPMKVEEQPIVEEIKKEEVKEEIPKHEEPPKYEEPTIKQEEVVVKEDIKPKPIITEVRFEIKKEEPSPIPNKLILDVGRTSVEDTHVDVNNATGEWKEAFTPEGKKYYYHTVTRESKWNLADTLKSPTNPRASIKTNPVPQQQQQNNQVINQPQSPQLVKEEGPSATPLKKKIII